MRCLRSKLFINPLMSLLWTFDLVSVARRNLYLDRLTHTVSNWEVQVEIANFSSTVRHRPVEPIPH
jgi:hypothetical protein